MLIADKYLRGVLVADMSSSDINHMMEYYGLVLKWNTRPSDNIAHMAAYWGPVIANEGPSKTLLRRIDRSMLAIIMIWKQAKRWVQVFRNRLLYAPGAAGYLEARQRFRFHQGLRVTRAQKRKWELVT